MTNIQEIETSKSSADDFTISMGRDNSGNRRLLLEGKNPGLTGADSEGSFPLSAENAAVLRKRISWLNPVPLGLSTSAGAGDRLGLATPGHINAFQGTGIAPVFAQQSVRENLRTHRTPQQVMDDAMWGVLEMGWQQKWGADGDHLKNIADIKSFVDAGFTFFTVDPGDQVINVNPELSLEALETALNEFSFSDFGQSLSETIAGYTKFQIPVNGVSCTPVDVVHAIRKYGNAILHVRTLYLELKTLKPHQPFDFEVSVDETDDPTSVFEHYFIANELRRLGVRWTSLAPRFIGRFEKGVDYLGDLDQFEKTYRIHAAIQNHFGNYKISLHSGSDKFSIYQICARYSENKIHLKTAGTSYLEALRIIAATEPKLFRIIYSFSREQYDIDKASYHVSADKEKMPKPEELPDEALPRILDDFHARQALHVCFGSVLDRYKNEMISVLVKNHEMYRQVLKTHFDRHLVAFRNPIV